MNARAADREQRRAPRRILLTGFMGAGKSSVAHELARRLSCRVIDLDQLINAREGRTPQEIISEDGEPRFRELETEALRAALEDDGARVISTGGGAWTMERNRALIKRHDCLTVWLDAPFELCWERIENESGTRPLARSREHAQKLYDERRASYSLADLHVHADEGRSAVELAAEVADRL